MLTYSLYYLFLASMTHFSASEITYKECFTLGNLHNCDHVNLLGHYELPAIKGCKTIDEDQKNLTTFKGRVLRYNHTVTEFMLWECLQFYVRTECSMGTGKTKVKTIYPVVTKKECSDMILLKKNTGYYKENLVQSRPNYYRNYPHGAPECYFLRKSWTHYAAHFKLRGFPAKVIGNSTLINKLSLEISYTSIKTIRTKYNFTFLQRIARICSLGKQELAELTIGWTLNQYPILLRFKRLDISFMFRTLKLEEKLRMITP